jgi:Na+/H+-translocating membrane pyrophosphatase
MMIGFRTGATVGMLTVGLGLLGASVVVLAFQDQAPHVLEGFGFGAALLAMFMRVGGGIFTKAADVGADLVGKVEQKHPRGRPAQRRDDRGQRRRQTSVTARGWRPTCSSRTRSRWWPR